MFIAFLSVRCSSTFNARGKLTEPTTIKTTLHTAGRGGVGVTLYVERGGVKRTKKRTGRCDIYLENEKVAEYFNSMQPEPKVKL